MKEEILKFRELGFSYNEIKEKLKCSKSTISYHCSKIENNDMKTKKNLIRKNKKQEKNKSFLVENDKVDLVITLRKERKTYNEISKIVNISKDHISKICRDFGLTNDRNFGSISNEIINNIKETYKKLKSIRKTSIELDISRDTIRKYIELEKEQYTNLTDKEKSVKYVIEWRRRKKIELVEYKGGSCELCGYNKCISALEFHHKDPNEKDFNISGKSWSYERLKNEVDKCILVCSNCHKEIHQKIEEDKKKKD